MHMIHLFFRMKNIFNSQVLSNTHLTRKKSSKIDVGDYTSTIFDK